MICDPRVLNLFFEIPEQRTSTKHSKSTTPTSNLNLWSSKWFSEIEIAAENGTKHYVIYFKNRAMDKELWADIWGLLISSWNQEDSSSPVSQVTKNNLVI